MTAKEYANKALELLLALRKEQGQWKGYSTPSLAAYMGVPNTSRDTLLKVLEKLELCGVIRKSGYGKYVWAINVEDWNRYNPFGRVQSKQEEPEQESKPEIPFSPSNSDESIQITSLREVINDKNKRIDELVEEVLDFKEKVSDLKRDVEEAKKGVKTIKIERYDGTNETLTDITLPSYFDKTLQLAEMGMNVLLVGPAGCGKSTLAEHVAKVLGRKFYKVGGSGGLQEHHLFGRIQHNITSGKDKFKSTPFLTAFEEGGVCLIDELDGADSNCMLALNPALDRSNMLPVPNRETPAIKHDDFVCIATANTFGRGATRTYAGRNQLDEATLDRFRIGLIECYYDDGIERSVCPDDKLRALLQSVRTRIEGGGLRRIMSTRFLADAHKMVTKKNWTSKDVLETFFSGWPKDERSKVEYGLSY